MTATIPYPRDRRAKSHVAGAVSLLAHASTSIRDASLEIGPSEVGMKHRLTLSLAIEYLRKATAELRDVLIESDAPVVDRSHEDEVQG